MVGGDAGSGLMRGGLGGGVGVGLGLVCGWRGYGVVVI